MMIALMINFINLLINTLAQPPPPNQSNCQWDQYQNNSNQCVDCPSPCRSCQSATICQSCDNGYYISGNTCLPCQSPCKTCSSTSTSCSSCVDGYAKVYQSNTCQLCTKPCLTCQFQVTDCQSCVDSANQNPSSCNCQSGKYMDTNFYCQDCQNPCLTCSSASVCQSCETGYLLSGNSCIPCTKPCLTCNTNVTTCSTCVDNANQTPSSCNCNPGYNLNTSTYMCIKCTHPCATCQNSVTYCLTCASTYTQTSSTCDCTSNQYETNTSPTQCINCSSICLTCSSSSTYCTSCDSSQHRIQSGNTCICMDGYYDSSGNCLQCNLPCLKCTGSPTNCTQCKDTLQILNDCHCPGGYFMNSSYICQSCQSPCINCSDLTNCLSCINTKYLSGTQCLSCQSPCVNCIDNVSKCLTCIDSLQNQINNQCICPDGYYIDSSYHCSLCSHPCSKCQTSDSYCLECKSTFSLDSTLHQCYCQDGYYKNTTITPSICDQCQLPCATCQNLAQQCLTCVDSNQVVNSSNQCICQQGWISNGNYCEKCHVSCIECQTSTNNCTLCKDPLHNNISGTCVCQSGYVNDSNYDCVSCTQPCATCQTTTIYCLSCTDTNHFINTSNQCICNDTYYSDTISTCLACTKPCNKCDSSGCIDCVDVNQVVNDLSQCICKDGYAMIGYNCIQCQDPCKTCLNQIDYCLSCIETQQIIINDKCVCQLGYVMIGVNCLKCQEPCLTCSNNQTECDTCIDSNSILSNKSCICKSGYIMIGFNCAQCQQPCETCQNTVDECLSCIDTNQIIQDFDCVCLDGFAMIGVNCQECQDPCQNCENSITSCLTCIDNHQEVVNNSCQCVDGYLMIGVYCQQCLEPCKTCEISITQCISCIDVNQITSNQTCICNDGYAMIGVNCFQCDQPCKTCADNINKCLSCIDANQIIDSNTCICKDGYYSIGNLCAQCQLPCKKCVNNSDICIECVDSNQIIVNQKCVCKNGFGISSVDQNYCTPCQYPCLECSLSSQTCTSCYDKGLFQLENNKCQCNFGYFQKDNQCFKCAPQCQTCQYSSDNCTSCSVIQFNSLMNSCQCNFGYYFDTALVCKKCLSPCLTCVLHYDVCTSCELDFSYLSNNKCKCTDGYYFDGSICHLCEQTCSICQSLDICNQSIDGYYLIESNQCNQCKSECKTCLNEQICIKCEMGFFLDLEGNCKTCIPNCEVCSDAYSCDQCLTGYFYNTFECQECDQNCSTCENSSIDCITCRPHYNLINQKCICFDGYFERDLQCLQCQFPCIQCLEINECQQCSPLIENLYLKENNLCECETGFFWVNNQCKKCEQTCLICITNQSNCLSCNYNLNRVLKLNKCVCSSGYFEDDQFNCISCKTQEGKTKEICQYQDCSDLVWTYGEQCDDGNNVNRDGCSNCLVDPFYSCKNQILEKSICFQCPPKCSKCSLNNQTNVTYCEICETGYYLLNGSCNKCDDKCLGCEETSIKCTKCRFLTNKQGQCVLCEYQNGFYSNFKTNQCESKCGDSILVNGEDCDDGNALDGDGCSKLCKYEPKYLCKDGICVTPRYPKPQLQSFGDISLYQNLRQFQLTYDQLLRIDSNFELKKVIKLYIESQNAKRPLDYQYQINQEIEKSQNTTQFGNLSLYINLTITNSSSNEFLVIYFENKSMIISQNGYIQQDDYVSCEISSIIILDQSTLNQVETASSSNSYMLYFIAVMAGCAILFGGIDIFYNLLDTLQMLSYFKYVNTQFPFNLKEFFNLFGFAQLSFISNFFQIYEYLDQFVNFQALPNLPQKISDDGLSPLFIINGSSILVVWMTLLGIYYVSFLTPKTLDKIKLKYYSDFPQKQTYQVKFNLYFLSFKIFITKICFIIVSEFIYSGMIRAHISTAYDYSFSTLLQIYSIDIGSKSFIIQFSQLLAVLAIIIYAFCVFMMVRISNMSSYSLRNPQNQLKYGSLFEGVVISKYSKYFNSLLLLKKIGFMIILIFTYYVPLIQIMNLILLSLIMVLFLIIFKPIQDRLEYVKQLSVDISMLLTQTFMAFLIFDDDFQQFSYEARQNVGWGCIICITSMLVVQILVDAIQQWILLIKKFKKLKRVIDKISKLFKKEEIKANHNLFNVIEFF